MTDHPRILSFVVACSAVLLLAGCSSLDVLNVISKSPEAAPVTLRYGASDRQQMDVYPIRRRDSVGGARADTVQSLRLKQDALAPVVVFFYGGAWATGSRKDYGFLARTFNDLGYVVVIPDYRLTPEVVYPGFLHDSAEAVRMVISRAREFGGDPRRIVLAGHSAGAYNAAMLGMDSRWLGEGDRQKIRGVIGLSSPLNFLPIQMPEARVAFSWPNTPRDTQPVEHVSTRSPPMLLLSARRDPLVDPQINSATMAERLKAAGVYVKMETYDGPLGLVSHSTIVASLSSRLSFLAPTIAQAKAFVEQVAN